MGYASYTISRNGEEIEAGYAVEATCEQKGCEAQIDRGLAHLCGQTPGGDEHGCGGYFCGEHLFMGSNQETGDLCSSCSDRYEAEHPETEDDEDSPDTLAAAAALVAHHREVTKNEYGSYIVAGFDVTDGIDGKARVSHATPKLDLLDPDRPSDDELAEARHCMVGAYAATLTDAGWTVERRGATSRKPYLLASR